MPSEPGFASSLGHRVAWIVLIIALCASAVGWHITTRLQRLGDRRMMGEEIEAMRAALSERLAIYENVLHGAAGLFEASDSVERREWNDYLRRVSIDERFPGIQAVGFAVTLTPAGLESFVRETRADGAPAFTVNVEDDADRLLIVKYVEPEELNQDLLGFDMGSDLACRTAADQCRASGRAVVSSQIALPAEAGERPASGFVMFVPIYRKGAPIETAEQRWVNCEGVVFGRVVMAQLLEEVLENRHLPLRVQVIDRSDFDSPAVVFDTAAGRTDGEARLAEEALVLVGGRRWVLRVSSTPEFEKQTYNPIVVVVGAGGVVVSFLLFAIAWSLSHTREHAVSMASAMTAKLRRTNEQLQREILDRERAQRSIKDSEALYHSLVTSLPLNIVRKDMEGRFTFANQRFCNEIGRALKDVLGKTEFELFSVEQAARHKQEDDRIMDTGNSLDAVQELRLSDDESRFVQVIKTPLRNGVGEVIGLQTISWDVTDKHRTEQELQHERDLLHTLLDNVPDRIYFKDDQSRFLRVSRAMLDLFGVQDPSQVLGRTDFDFFGEEHARQAYRDEQRIIRTGQPVIGLVEQETLSGGEVRWAFTTKMPMRDDSGRVIGTFGISRDITQMKEAEAGLQHERDLLHTLLDHSPDRIYFKDRESRFLRVSRALLERHKAKDASEVVGKTDFDLFTEEHARQAYEDEQRIIRTGQPVIGLVEKETMPDGEVLWASTSKMPLKSESGEIVGTFGISRDITEIKRASEALREAKEAAEQANQTKSQFLANMSHELRTPLNSIIGFSNLLMKNREGRLGKSDLNFLERVLANGKHLLELINQILDLSKIEARRVELEMTAVRLEDLVRQTVEEQEGLVRERPVELSAELPDRMAPVRADREKLKQVLINLIGNALKFTERGKVTVRVVTDPTDGHPVRIEVADTGVGIPREKLGAIFEAFQQADATTARRYGGTGLGLTISKALCDLMGYRVEVTSEEGTGSTFSLDLRGPASAVGARSPSGDAPAPHSMATTSTPSPVRIEGKRVLVIDDEADSRMLLRHMLQDFGCEVFEAASGEEGLRMARELRPDLVTLDLMMPRMSGVEVVGAFRGDPNLKAIPVVVVSIVSGEHRGHILGAVDLLQKPIVREELLAALQRNLPRTAPRILVVDDEQDARDLMRSLLEPEGCRVRTVVNGQEALTALKTDAYDLVLLDLMMPRMDGFTLLTALRSDPAFRRLPVVVVTAKDLSRKELKELRAQASDILQKSPEFEQELKGLLGRLFSWCDRGAAPNPR